MLKNISLILLGSIIISSALDLELSTEGSCNRELTSISLDPSWFEDSSTKWHVLMGSKYELYQIAIEVLRRKPEDISDQEFKNLCPFYTINSTDTYIGMETTGFGGEPILYDGKLGENGTLLWKVNGREDWEHGWITKKGADYFVLVNCWNNGQKSWAVNTKLTKIPNTEKKEIIEHLKSIGFTDLKYFYEYNYDECRDDVSVPIVKNCLPN